MQTSIGDGTGFKPGVKHRTHSGPQLVPGMAAVNATRWALFNTLKSSGLPVTTCSGGLTKFNRVRFEIPKTHALDAACVGATESVTDWQMPTLAIKATGRGSYQRTRLDKYGFPRGYLTREKRIKGFQTGDMVTATVPTGKKTGIHSGRVAVRATGSFNIQTAQGLVQGISHRFCKIIQHADGYGYSQIERGCQFLPALKDGVSLAYVR